MFLNNYSLVSNGTVFERINETQILKQIHSNPFSYRNKVMATGPKKLIVSFLLNYFVFKKIVLKFHKNLLAFMKTSYAFSNISSYTK